MLNIISRSILSPHISGPRKVVENLIKGLEKIHYPYIINGALDSTQRLWIHDDTSALKEIKNLDQEIKILAGPNLYVLPRNIPETIDLSLKNFVYIQPSPWVIDFWKYLGFSRCELDYWPTGIDTEIHTPSSASKKQVLVYFKQRSEEELHTLKKILEQKKINYKIIVYGKYKHAEYINELETAKYVIWLGRQESQGLALEEALAINVPLLVWDIKKFGQWTASPKEMDMFNQTENEFAGATCAYFFDKRCGIKIKDEGEISDSIDVMEKNFQTFKPRAYILENLNLEKQARDFVNLYDKHFGLTLQQGLLEKRRNSRDWRNQTLLFKIFIRGKDMLKDLLGKTN